MMTPGNKAVFIDKDGTLIPDIPYNVNVDLIQLEQATIEGLTNLKAKGFLLIVVSNQSGVAKGYFREEELTRVWERIEQLLLLHQLTLDGFYYCPHHPVGTVQSYAIACDCRKPLPGLIVKAAHDLDVDLPGSWMIGDILNDVEAGKRAGCRTVLINNGNETEWVSNEWRMPDGIAKNINEAAAFIIASSNQSTM